MNGANLSLLSLSCACAVGAFWNFFFNKFQTRKDPGSVLGREINLIRVASGGEAGLQNTVQNQRVMTSMFYALYICDTHTSD